MPPTRKQSTSVPEQCCDESQFEYTDVCVIGSGPSGIFLSFLLCGNHPYLNGTLHQDELIGCRIEDLTSKNLLFQDLRILSDEVEGRSIYGLSNFFDCLMNPMADLNLNLPSCLDWKVQKEANISHIVIGKHKPGGAWQMIGDNMRTLSLSDWMELPDFPFKTFMSNNRTNSMTSDRACVADVRAYYEAYVKEKKLSEKFRSGWTVTAVERIVDTKHRIDCESGEQMPCCKAHKEDVVWEVRGFDQNGENFYVRSKAVVLATGTYNQPNRLLVAGEHHPFVDQNNAWLEELRPNTESMEPVVIVGAGLSAADSILCALARGIPLFHVFRKPANCKSLVFEKLPGNIYPEYHQVARLMRGVEKHPRYVPLERHRIVQFCPTQCVVLQNLDTGTISCVKVSRAVVQIGSSPDLSYLVNSGENLSRIPGKPVCIKDNPLLVDSVTFESAVEPSLYAVGPLIGENFVRFIRGGAIGVVAHLLANRMKKTETHAG